MDKVALNISINLIGYCYTTFSTLVNMSKKLLIQHSVSTQTCTSIPELKIIIITGLLLNSIPTFANCPVYGPKLRNYKKQIMKDFSP